MFTRRILTLCLIVGLASLASSLRADEPAAKKPSSLDDALLEGLGGDPTKDPKSSEAKPKRPAKNPLDDKLLEGLDESMTPEKDPAGDEDENPLVRLNRQMRSVEKAVGEGDAGASTQTAQKKIVDELDELIRQAMKQQQQNPSSSKNQNQQQESAQRERVAQSKPSTQPNPQPGKSRESTDRQGPPPEPVKPEDRQLADVLKQIWGELPPRLREQMMQSSNEKFVPKYETAIEDYFRALAAPRDED